MVGWLVRLCVASNIFAWFDGKIEACSFMYSVQFDNMKITRRWVGVSDVDL